MNIKYFAWSTAFIHYSVTKVIYVYCICKPKSENQIMRDSKYNFLPSWQKILKFDTLSAICEIIYKPIVGYSSK